MHSHGLVLHYILMTSSSVPSLSQRLIEVVPDLQRAVQRQSTRKEFPDDYCLSYI